MTEKGDKELLELERLRHSAAHVMADAVCRLFPGVKITVIGAGNVYTRFAAVALITVAPNSDMGPPVLPNVSTPSDSRSPVNNNGRRCVRCGRLLVPILSLLIRSRPSLI